MFSHEDGLRLGQEYLAALGGMVDADLTTHEGGYGPDRDVFYGVMGNRKEIAAFLTG